MATILALILFVPLALIITIALTIGAVSGGSEGIDAAGNIIIILIECAVFIPLLVGCCKLLF